MNDQAGLYIHVPFCIRKCGYCDFYSTTRINRIEAWEKSVSDEATLYRDRFPSFDTVYIGGGTPSLLPPVIIANLLARLRKTLCISPGAELTLEVNPDDLTLEKVAIWQACGINRISLGIQSLNDLTLQFLGRRHDALKAENSLEIIRDAGFSCLSVDLIYAVPGESEEQWFHTLARVLKYTPDHLSCYELTLGPKTPLGKDAANGNLVLPSEEKLGSLFLRTSEYLSNRGYQHYEVSNYARGPMQKCRHNLKYWQRKPYLGLGPAAHSFDGLLRWWNPPSIDTYCEILRHGRFPRKGIEKLNDDDQRLEEILLAFRTNEGIDPVRLGQGEDIQKILQQLLSAGLVRRENNRIIPTPAGYLVADSLPLLFI